MNNAALMQAMKSAVTKHQAGELVEAEAEYRRLMQAAPDNTEVLRLLSALLLQRNLPNDAVDLMNKAVALRGNDARLHGTLGSALRSAGRMDDAAASFEHALRLDPSNAEVISQLARLKLQLGQIEQATELLQKAVALHPKLWQAHLSLADCLLRKKDYSSAHDHFVKAYELMPLMPTLNGARASALGGMGAVAASVGSFPEARMAFERAIALAPRDAHLQFQLGACLRDLGQVAQAEQHLRKAIEIDPNLADAHRMLGQLVPRRGEHAESLEHLRRAIELEPHNFRQHSGLLMTLNYSDALSPQDVFESHLDWSRRHAVDLDSDPPAIADPDPARKLRVGYVSQDFRRHAVASFLLPLLLNHDRQKYEIVCYSDVANPDGITERIRAGVAEFHSVRELDEARLAERVRKDRIDVLIDLAGHTDHNRLLAFARRPAPVQITYLGYPNTTGMSAMNYRLTDAIADPPGAESFHVEKLLRIDGCFLCFQPLEGENAIASAPSSNNGFITFGSFNNTTKISPTTAAIWSAAMHAIPDSRLVIKSLKLTDQATRDGLSDFLASHEIPVQRVAMLGPQPTFADHLSDYSHVDIALDTFPYNGTTTTCEALWMGVPVVTMSGDRHAARVSASLLSALGQSDWVAKSQEEFAKIAANLAKSLPDRRELRKKLQSSRLMNGPAHARAVEMCIRSAWQETCEAGV